MSNPIKKTNSTNTIAPKRPSPAHYRILKKQQVKHGFIYQIEDTNLPGEVALTLALNSEDQLLVWGDTGSNQWHDITNREFYRKIAKQCDIL